MRTTKVLSSPSKEYRVSWVGYADAEWSWEPEANLASAAGVIAAFENASDTRGKRCKLPEPHPGSRAAVADVDLTNGDIATPALALTAEGILLSFGLRDPACHLLRGTGLVPRIEAFGNPMVSVPL